MPRSLSYALVLLELPTLNYFGTTTGLTNGRKWKMFKEGKWKAPPKLIATKRVEFATESSQMCQENMYTLSRCWEIPQVGKGLKDKLTVTRNCRDAEHATIPSFCLVTQRKHHHNLKLLAAPTSRQSRDTVSMGCHGTH